LISPEPWRFAGKAAVEGLGPLEAIIALKPDLDLLNSFGTDARADKLRAAGIEAFNLGELHGLSTLLPMAEVIATLLGAPERGQRYAEGFRQRFERVAAPLGTRPRRRAMYLSVISNTIIIGGTVGTSYHDVLTHAGLVDVAAEHYSGWPQLSAEQIIALDPELVVTKDDTAGALCAYPGLDRLQACHEPGGILALPAGLLDEPGPAMLAASERLFALAYPALSGRAPGRAPP
jgi:ABC-type Fe3+-hydroxamate transport system substrate-binding protein